MHRAIETRYKGRRFRSRLEARWAVVFETLGIKWDYEPEGFELGAGLRYLPDFLVHFDPTSSVVKQWPGAGYWIEIKPTAPTDAEIQKLQLVVNQTGHHGVFLCGSPWDAKHLPIHRGETWPETTKPKPWQYGDPLLFCAPAVGKFATRLRFAVGEATSARFEYEGRA
jgi:hypothetical protein